MQHVNEHGRYVPRVHIKSIAYTLGMQNFECLNPCPSTFTAETIVKLVLQQFIIQRELL
uniref:Uncharacterized protein n=1 Tax=Arundo donax TaxID=35708 RepID=A0A0A9AKV2_ARUDO